MDPGKALGASLEIIKALYETAELYRRLETINGEILNEIALLVSLQDQITSSQRMANNAVVNNYLQDINRKLTKIKRMVEDIGSKNMFYKIIYTQKIKRITTQVSGMIRKLKVLLELKREMTQASKLDVANIISDEAGRTFWEKTFGSDHLFVQQSMFFGALRMHTRLLATEIDFLKKVVNDDRDKFISAFEFQEWLDFFGDMSVAMRRSIDSLLDPKTYDMVAWYQPSLNRHLVRTYLYDNLFIVRKHATQKGVFIINYKLPCPSTTPPPYLLTAMPAPASPASPPLPLQPSQEFPDRITPPPSSFNIHNMYIKNRENQFHIETVGGMQATELEIMQRIDIKHSVNLRDIVLRLENVITQIMHPTSSPDANAAATAAAAAAWENERQKMLDAEVGENNSNNHSFFTPPQFVSSIFESANAGLSSVMNALPTLPDVPNILPEIPEIPIISDIPEFTNSIISYVSCVKPRNNRK